MLRFRRLLLISLTTALFLGLGVFFRPLTQERVAGKSVAGSTCSNLVGVALRAVSPTPAYAQAGDRFEPVFEKAATGLGMPLDFLLRAGTWTVTSANFVEPDSSPLALLNVYPLRFTDNGDIAETGLRDKYLWELAQQIGEGNIQWSSDDSLPYSGYVPANDGQPARILLDPEESPLILQRKLARALVTASFDRACNFGASPAALMPILEAFEDRVRVVQWLHDLKSSGADTKDIEDLLKPEDPALPEPYASLRFVLDRYGASAMRLAVGIDKEIRKTLIEPLLEAGGREDHMEEDAGFQEQRASARFALWVDAMDSLAECIEKKNCGATGPVAGEEATEVRAAVSDETIPTDNRTIPQAVLDRRKQIQLEQKIAEAMKQAFEHVEKELAKPYDPYDLSRLKGSPNYATPYELMLTEKGLMEKDAELFGRAIKHMEAIREGNARALNEIVGIVREHPWFRTKFDVSTRLGGFTYEVFLPTGATEPVITITRSYQSIPGFGLKLFPSLATVAWSYIRSYAAPLFRPVGGVVGATGSLIMRGLGIVSVPLLANDLWDAIYKHQGEVNLFPGTRQLIVEKWKLDGDLRIPPFEHVEEVVLREIATNGLIIFQGLPKMKKLTIENVSFPTLPRMSFVPVEIEEKLEDWKITVKKTLAPGALVKDELTIEFRENGWDALPPLDGLAINDSVSVTMKIRELNLRKGSTIIPLLKFFETRGRSALIAFDSGTPYCNPEVAIRTPELERDREQAANMLKAVNQRRSAKGLLPIDLRCPAVMRFIQ